MLTDAQKTDARRWAGWATLNDGEPDYVFSNVASFGQVSLTHKLAGLSAAEEGVLTTTYLTILATLEAAIPAAADNMDTDTAGPWKANRNEMSERTGLFNKWRRDMCAFLGIPPGPGLGSGSINLVRG